MKKRILAVAMAAAMALSMAVTAVADETAPEETGLNEGVTKTIQLDGATFTLTAAAIADGEEITITASGMEDGYDSWCITIHPVKDNLEYFSGVLEDGQSDFVTRAEAVDAITNEWNPKGFVMEPNTSRTFTLHIPEEFEGWTVDARISGKLQGTYSTDIDPLILVEGEQSEVPAEGEQGEAPAEGEQGETPVQVSFDDVSENDWFYRYVTIAAASGQMTGMGDGKFDPSGNLTVAQVLTLAARADMEAKGIEDTTVSDGPWYARFVDYCVENEIIAADRFSEEDMNRPATRYEMVEVLDKVAGESITQPINDVPNGFIPDLNEEDPYGDIIYKWYRAGITVGDENHRYNGEKNITRAETAVIICHLSNMVEHAVIK